MTDQRRTVITLATGQTLSQIVVIMMITLSAVIGSTLAPDVSLATMPAAAFIVGTAIAMIPASLFMQRFGRRPGFMLGATFGLAGTVTCAAALGYASFAAFSAGSLLVGIYQGFSQYYRFAAADVATPEFRSRAISWVLVGGVLAAIAGPEIAKRTGGLGDVRYAVPFLIAAGLCAVAVAVVATLRIPHTRRAADASSGRPLGRIMRQPQFFVAAAGAAAAYGVMTLAMVATPLAMIGHQHTVADAALVIQFHVLGMFLPSFFTGSLIHRFGVLPVMGAGIVLLATHVFLAVTGVTLPHFVSALVFLGLGWNFLYVGGTTLLIEAYRPDEKAKTQAANDLIVFGCSTAASLSSGALLASIGWTGVNLAALPVLGLIAVVMTWYGTRRPVTAAA